MRYWLFWSCFLSFWSALEAQSDSVRVIIHLNPATDEIEMSYGYEEARAALDPVINMYNLQRGVKTLATQFHMLYDEEEDAWVTKVPWGFYELRIESLGFKDIIFPMRLKKDLRQEFELEVDSTSYTYANRKRYNYIVGTRHFNSTVFVRFKDEGDPADYRAFIQEIFLAEGLEGINLLRMQKVRGSNAFLLNLEIIAQVPLNILLYKKITQQQPIEPGFIIGGAITKVIERLQANASVRYANPTFIDDPDVELLRVAGVGRSTQLERKLLRLMEDDPQTLDKINYIIQKTTPPSNSSEE